MTTNFSRGNWPIFKAQWLFDRKLSVNHLVWHSPQSSECEIRLLYGNFLQTASMSRLIMRFVVSIDQYFEINM